MRGFSLTQPWATAVALEIKKWETRSWACKPRNDVAIHAAKSYPKWAREFTVDQQSVGGLPRIYFPLGRILCVADITLCLPTEAIVDKLSEVEKRWGDYSPGRFAFQIQNVRPLQTPIQCSGALSFWVVPNDIVIEVLRQMKISRLSLVEAQL